MTSTGTGTDLISVAFPLASCVSKNSSTAATAAASRQSPENYAYHPPAVIRRPVGSGRTALVIN